MTKKYTVKNNNTILANEYYGAAGSSAIIRFYAFLHI